MAWLSSYILTVGEMEKALQVSLDIVKSSGQDFVVGILQNS